MVNITEVSEEAENLRQKIYSGELGDKFDSIWTLALELQKKYGNNGININTKEGQKKLREFAWYITEELAEAVNLLKIRPWSHTEYPTEKVHFYEEIGDAFFFFLAFCFLAGMSKEDFIEYFCRKYAVNDFRIRSNY